MYSYYCYQAGNLVIHKDTLTLSLSDIVVSSSITIQGWYYIEAYVTAVTPSPPNVITLMSLTNLVKVEYSNDIMSMKIYGVAGVELSNTLTIPIASIFQKWLHMAVVLKSFKWTLYINSIPTLTVIDTT